MTWQDARLKFLAAEPIRNGLGEAGIEGSPSWPRYVRTTDIAGPRLLRDDVFASLPPDVAKGAMLKCGDIVMTAAGATIGKSLLYNSEAPACYAGYLVRFSPRVDVDGRFVAYWMESQAYWDQIAAGKVVSTIENFSASKYQNLRLRVPERQAQRAIADHLDAETARIDAVIERKRRMVELLGEQFEAFKNQVIWSGVQHTGPLMRRTDPYRPIMYGIVLPGPNVDDGVPIVKGGDVAARRLSPDQLNRTTCDIEAPYARARLAKNDLVYAIRGGVGDVELVPASLIGANITQDVARIAPAMTVSPVWLRFVLGTLTVRYEVETRITGATIRGLNIWELKRVRIPMSDSDRQARDQYVLMEAEARAVQIGKKISRHIDLLIEHRQALITAAVTGQLSVAGLAA